MLANNPPANTTDHGGIKLPSQSGNGCAHSFVFAVSQKNIQD
jgi:hypothetical protein